MSDIDKITGNSPEAKSLDITQQNIEQLKQIFPDVFSENKIDFEALKAVLGEEVDDSEERYNFTWNGKTKARQIAQTPSTGTLRPCKEESVNWDTTENLFIEGDNLEVLKLLQKSYHKQVKMIYIDVPYNTGKDFVYKDNFHDNIQNYLEQTGQVDNEGRRISNNLDTSGRFHSDWLNMMYPRLKLARNMLTDDGVIFISIDSNEVFNLRLLCDQIFGENNFCSEFIVKSNPRGSQSNGYSANQHEYVLCFAKDIEVTPPFSISLSEDMESEYNLNDESGRYRLLGLRLRGGSWRREQRPLLYYPIYVEQNGDVSTEDNGGVPILPVKPSTGEDGTWRWSKEKLAKDKHLIKAKLVQRNGDSVWDIFTKDYLNSGDGEQKGTKPKSIFDEKEVNYQNGTNEIKAVFNGQAPFDFPKPTYLIKKLIEMHCGNDDLIMDFFAGSGTTAQAVNDLKTNKFILVQLPEPTVEKSNGYKLGYKNIAEITRERISKSGCSFRYFKLDETNIRPWDADFDNLEQVLQQATESIKADRSSEDVLYEIFLKYGYDLTTPVETEVVNGKTVFVVGAGALIVCLDDDITGETVEGIAKLKEELDPETTQVVFKDAGFADSNVKTNAIQILKQAGIDDVKSI
ncbi:site-specific DNA-methyltransferase [Vibrio crassostreae]|uniref:site-specific DNA-methyltransferase n=1 Tax=Vibrio crassostreae TaxID=246167 RepID=UPI001B30B788|nr:site-specific DNA-methyltransferase [Vibrio crassostreae]CAK2030663.1 adenine-specific DNA-methyltransferase [Vibrio crassostreae]CAK2949300.1 adenine-specific DNA-methyltransferase [Vibrio crassostreae]CAK2996916.1 adenine-specific DNA-methyltransferase [Vibrio crassostreae]CAK3620101.1 adenine-specific DNA-methyltransferase [Vibrio crassostreae]